RAWAAFEQRRTPVWVGRYGRSVGGSAHGPFAHDYAVVMLITRGRSRMRHGAELTLREGDVHLIPPGDPHGAPHFEGVEGWGLAFRLEAFAQGDAGGWGDAEGGLRLGPLLRVREGCHPVLTPTRVQRRRLEGWLRLLRDECLAGEGQREHAQAVGALLRLLLIELERVAAPAAVPESAGLGLARRALTHIEAHGLGPLSLADVARAVGRSGAHVASVVRQETGRTVGEWIRETRMAEARRRLRGTDEQVEIIAERVGYADVTHFIRVFRRTHGVTPAAWRKSPLPLGEG
ncbi:MAG TPA: AraC family transcriptional regulator, partial [Aggregicoccus sp.]|nr:AraC family transcriptional regulator [Aggregicoccus sp.]